MVVKDLLAKYGEQQDDSLIYALIFIMQNYLSVSDDQLDTAVTLAARLTKIDPKLVLTDVSTASEHIALTLT